MHTNLLFAVTAAAALGAQPLPQDPRLPIPESARTAGDDRDWLLPIRADQDEPGAFWASGPTYKVRFADGMTFHPVLGADAPRNLPLGWRTESIGFGDRTADPVTLATARADAWRFELARPGVVEAYDVLAHGVEQSFVFADPGAGVAGDLVIRGRIDTPLHCGDRMALHAPLRFADATGRDVIEYGAALAFDASGRRIDITTAYQGGVVELRVPAAWLAAATWPVTVDPVTQRVTLPGSILGAASYPTVTHDHDTDRFVVTDSRPVSAADYDLVLRLRSGAFGAVATIFSDLSTASTRHASVARGGSTPRRWVLAYQRETATASRVRVYFHDIGDLGSNTGQLREIPLPAGYHDAEPSLGAYAADHAYLAVRRDISPVPANTEASYPVGFRIDIQAQTTPAGTALHTNPGNNFDVEHIAVSSLGGGWTMVVWQEYNFDNPNDDWDILCHLINGSTPNGYAVLGEGGNDSLHKLSPVVDGYATGWAVAYLTRANTGTKNVGLQGSVLRVQRFGWDSLNGPRPAASRVVDFAVGNDLVLGGTNRPFALAGTTSHWGLVWKRTWSGELHAARIGSDGGVAEYALLEPAPASGSMFSPSLCWDWSDHDFAVVYASAGAATWDPMYSRRFRFDDRAVAIAYGASCTGTLAGRSSALFDDNPYAGLASYTLELTGGRPNAVTVLFAGVAPTDVPLPSSIAGCRLLLNPAFPIVVAAQGLSTATGRFDPYFPIPSSARGTDLRWQNVQFDQGKLWSSNGLRTVIY